MEAAEVSVMLNFANISIGDFVGIQDQMQASLSKRTSAHTPQESIV